MAKKKGKKPHQKGKQPRSAAVEPQTIADTEGAPIKPDAAAAEPAVTQERLDGSADEHEICRRVWEAHDHAQHKRNQYKKYGPLTVIITGVLFLTLMFTLENKILFLILWIISVLYTVGLMVRAEYKYHQFRVILGLETEEPEEDDGKESKEEATEGQEEASTDTNETKEADAT